MDAASVAELLGVPVEAATDPPAVPSSVAMLRRHAVEAAWLLRHGLERSATP